jgi:D-sorbitol dehydrogenase (acceptor)
MQLKDKIAIVTGAAVGIGEAVVRRYLDEGAKVVVVDVKPRAELEKTYSDIPAVRILLIQADVTAREGIEGILSATVERFGRVDILFNNAAILTCAHCWRSRGRYSTVFLR